jgi:hypothetical protein
MLSILIIKIKGGEIMNPMTETIEADCDSCIGCVGCAACTPESDALFAVVLTGTIGY